MPYIVNHGTSVTTVYDKQAEIKAIRAANHLTQQQMSDLTGIPRRTIEDWEAGRRNPPEWLPKMIKAYLALQA